MQEHGGSERVGGSTRGDVDRLAFAATRHCLTGCAIGEVLGFVLAGALGLEMLPGMALAIALAFLFGYSLTLFPLVAGGIAVARAIPLTFAADTVSITVMEAVDNLVILVVPGAMEAGLDSVLFWASLAFGFAVAFAVTFPVNRALIARGRGHAAVHGSHAGHGGPQGR